MKNRSAWRLNESEIVLAAVALFLWGMVLVQLLEVL